MKLTDSQLKILILGSNLISYDMLAEAEREAKERSMPLVEFLPSAGLIEPDQIGKIVADALQYSFVDLRKEKVDKEVLDIIPETMARAKGVVAFAQTDRGVKLGMTDPEDLETLHLVEKRVGKKVMPYYITRQDLESTLSKYKGSLKEGFKNILEQLKNDALSAEERDETTIKVVDILLLFGHENKASDIHIEPTEEKVLVRFRIDGVMHDVLDIPKSLFEPIISRIKILSKMRTDEHRAAQDGKLRFETKTEAVDVRVSILPTISGEKVVMRVLSSQGRRFSLVDLGLSDDNMKKLTDAIENPHGMILVTGPTGSGKTTTIYGVMKILNKRDVNITTIEDPVEYRIGGVNQIQVNAKTGLTFAKGLRAIVRQDPDIIMVGEIRDEETASIAVNSALTGHLVLSTLHTNDAATTLPRLLDMNIEPFLVASTVNVAIAQRLVRQICTNCRASCRLDEEEIRTINLASSVAEIVKSMGYEDLHKVRLYKGMGCDICGHTGFTGRVGIFEVLEVNEEIRELIVQRASSDQLVRAAKKNGMTTMLYDGVDKAFRGVTTLLEVVRMTRE